MSFSAQYNIRATGGQSSSQQLRPPKHHKVPWLRKTDYNIKRIAEEITAQESLRSFLQSRQWQPGKVCQFRPLVSFYLVKLFCSVATSYQEPSLIPIFPFCWHFMSQWRGHLLLSQWTVCQEQSPHSWLQMHIPVGASDSTKTDPAAETLQKLGSLRASSLRLVISLTN